LTIIGTLLMVIPIQLAGLEGMPVDVYKFYADTGMSAYNLLGSLGAFTLALGVILTMVNAAASFNNGTRAGHDAWGGSTLEWFALSPPPPHNFDLVPDVRSNEPYRDIREAVNARATSVVLPEAKPADEREAATVAAAVTEEEAPAPEAGAVTEQPAEPTADPQTSADAEEHPDGDGPVA
jgi:heme/copper-type cytochrome/quinol oxidase subunit 1